MTAFELLRDGAHPKLYATLGARFHLEPLLPEDVERLERANEYVLDWIGGELRQTNHSFIDEITPFRPSDLDFISEYPSSLEGGESETALGEGFTGLVAQSRRGLSVAVNGGTTSLAASPFKYSFVSDVIAHDEARMQALAVLEVHVPGDWPSEDFARRVTELSSFLRLRWGNAGWTYSHWHVSDPHPTWRRMAAHAQRHWGFDVGWVGGDLERAHARIRSVSWLTWIGDSLREETGIDPLARAATLVRGAPGPGWTLLRAGATPEQGDINRLQIPPAYREADLLVRRARASDAVDWNWPEWSETRTTEWLRRFERAATWH